MSGKIRDKFVYSKFESIFDRLSETLTQIAFHKKQKETSKRNFYSRNKFCHFLPNNSDSRKDLLELLRIRFVTRLPEIGLK